jgi:putative CRISPR-associated protein (TIGR02619 family)
LTNQADDVLRGLLSGHANIKKSEDVSNETERHAICGHIKKKTTEFEQYSVEQAVKNSAELAGILAYYEGQPAKGKQDMHFLLATDTWLGEATAEIVKRWLRSQEIANVTVIRHTDLQTADWSAFRSSLSGLVKWCEDTIKPYQEKQYKVVFNLSGGFKSETGFLQTLGMFYADEIIYMFERSGELMRIPKLPVKMDDETSVRSDINDFRRASLGLSVAIPKSGIYWFEVDGKYALEPWGEMVFAQHKSKLYEEKILPSSSPKITFANGFLKSCENETPKHKRQINEAIDLLAQFKEKDDHSNPESLNYHPIQNGQNGETHEIYAWSDEDAKRIYCREAANGVTELIRLGKHL